MGAHVLRAKVDKNERQDEKWGFLAILLRKTNLMRRAACGYRVCRIIRNRGRPISIYFRPAAIALVRDPLTSSSFNAHTYAPPSFFFLM